LPFSNETIGRKAALDVVSADFGIVFRLRHRCRDKRPVEN
jgi:hypothetical protein